MSALLRILSFALGIFVIAPSVVLANECSKAIVQVNGNLSRHGNAAVQLSIPLDEIFGITDAAAIVRLVRFSSDAWAISLLNTEMKTRDNQKYSIVPVAVAFNEKREVSSTPFIAFQPISADYHTTNSQVLINLIGLTQDDLLPSYLEITSITTSQIECHRQGQIDATNEATGGVKNDLTRGKANVKNADRLSYSQLLGYRSLGE